MIITMNEQKKLKERLKTLAVVGLALCSMVLLYLNLFASGFTSVGGISRLIDNIFGKNQPQIILQSEQYLPRQISLNYDSSRYVPPYNTIDMTTLFEKSRPVLAQAVSSASGFVPIDQEAWRAALLSKGIYVDLGASLPFDLAAHFTGGVQKNQDFTVQHIILAQTGQDGFNLYVKGPEQLARTSVRPDKDMFLALFDQFPKANARLMFDSPQAQTVVAPEFLYFSSPPKMYSLTAKNPLENEDIVKNILDKFDIGKLNTSQYPETGGTVYVEGMATLTVYNRGEILYKDPDTQFVSPTFAISKPNELSGRSAAIVKAYEFVLSVVDAADPDIGLGIRDFYYQGDQLVVLIGYNVGGVPVDIGEAGYCARVKLNNEKITEVYIKLKGYEISHQENFIMSGSMAAAAATGHGKERVALRYKDTGDEMVSAGWYYG